MEAVAYISARLQPLLQKNPQSHTDTAHLPSIFFPHHQHAPPESPPESPSSTMSTKGCQAQATAGGGGGGGGNRAPTAGSTPPPRRGQIKEKIIKDVVSAVVSMAAGLVAGADKNGGGGLPVAGDADGK